MPPPPTSSPVTPPFEGTVRDSGGRTIATAIVRAVWIGADAAPRCDIEGRCIRHSFTGTGEAERRTSASAKAAGDRVGRAQDQEEVRTPLQHAAAENITFNVVDTASDGFINGHSSGPTARGAGHLFP